LLTTMDDCALDLQILQRELSALAGQEVHFIRSHYSDGTPCYMILPTDRGELKSGFWEALRASPTGGIWLAPEEALLGFASFVIERRAKSKRVTPGDLELELERLLSNGPARAAELVPRFEKQGVSRHALGRAARRLGVVRLKQGMKGGWVWMKPQNLADGASSTSPGS
jgi:hypothetical protein